MYLVYITCFCGRITQTEASHQSSHFIHHPTIYNQVIGLAVMGFVFQIINFICTWFTSCVTLPPGSCAASPCSVLHGPVFSYWTSTFIPVQSFIHLFSQELGNGQNMRNVFCSHLVLFALQMWYIYLYAQQYCPQKTFYGFYTSVNGET